MSDSPTHDAHQESGWREWSNYVLAGLEKTDERITALETRLRASEAEIQVLKAKVALYVAIASSFIVISIQICRVVFK